MKGSPPELVARFARVTAGFTGVERRKMFGYPALVTGGNMIGGLMRDTIVLRLPEADRTLLLGSGQATPFVAMGGRTMREWVALTPALLNDDAALRRWIEAARCYTASLPPKAGKVRKRPSN